MDGNEFFPSKWLSAESFGDKKVVTKIKSVSTESLQSDEDKKLVLFFEDENLTKGMILNRTNFSRLKEELGAETDHWIGRYVELYTIQTDFRGKEVPALRLKVVQPPVTA